MAFEVSAKEEEEDDDSPDSYSPPRMDTSEL